MIETIVYTLLELGLLTYIGSITAMIVYIIYSMFGD